MRRRELKAEVEEGSYGNENEHQAEAAVYG